MIKIIVDTNIVFSALLNPAGNFSEILLSRTTLFQLFSCDSLKEELTEHRPKLLKYSKLSDEELTNLELLIFSKINFVNELFIPKKHLVTAKEMLK